jgi:hypothetical protein
MGQKARYHHGGGDTEVTRRKVLWGKTKAKAKTTELRQRIQKMAKFAQRTG